MSAQESAPQVWRPEHLRLAIDAASVALWSWNVASNRFAMDARAFALWGLDWATEVTFEALSAHIHPADRDRVREAFEATRSVAAAFEIDFRIVVGDDVRWISARGQGAEAGAQDALTFGIFIDVTNRKQAEESHELLAGEMSHRVKNLLAIATSLTHITSRSSASIAEMTTALTERLTALGRAHEVVRPLPGDQGKAALLGDLFSVLLAPYDDDVAFASRIRVAVPRLGIGERTATTLALVIHEMATNSVKHGALSAATGTVDVSSATEGRDLLLIWAETGGPTIASPPDMQGFGSKMIARSISHELDGTLTYDWQPAGLVAKIKVRKDRLSA